MSKKKIKNLEDILQSLDKDEVVYISYSSTEDEENKKDNSD
ncbi:MAG: hypothetical protein ACFFDK_08340 [Promethearchaeota archaeon]